ncbi:unnamed protein product [Allacma fusca]|uniref:Uncharacterized protein n=1 Tax=Allacma fusca TaxID=39272 RepID=A0A8J2KVM1_9HEXA|nr:unnamed protein product [Allacma fusca]
MLERCIIPFAEGGMDEKYLSESDDEIKSNSLTSSLTPGQSPHPSPPRKIPRMANPELEDPSRSIEDSLPDPTLCLLVTAELAREVIRFVSLDNCRHVP